MLDENTFVTNFINFKWLSYPAATTIRVWFPFEVGCRVPKPPIGLVGTVDEPNFGPDFVGGANFTDAVGQLAYYNFLNTNPQTVDNEVVSGGFWATNGTCSPYFARFEVDFLPDVTDQGCCCILHDDVVNFVLHDGGAPPPIPAACNSAMPPCDTVSDEVLLTHFNSRSRGPEPARAGAGDAADAGDADVDATGEGDAADGGAE
jgi:hypothetical protein